MRNPDRPDLCVIGAGAAGLTVAGGAAQMGARVVLVEAGAMGGECLNSGCVPSKALLAAATAAAGARSAAALGIDASPRVDFARVMAHVHATIRAIAPNDSEERFRGWGVDVIRARACFIGPAEVEAGGRRIRARRFVVATGSAPLIPPVPGLADTPHLTNETLFGLTVLPAHLLVLGGGAVGCEMAQAFARLGSEVTLIESGRILPRDDPDAVALVRSALEADGVRILTGTRAARAEAGGPGVRLTLPDGVVEGTHLLVAAGRAPRTQGIGLEAAGVDVGPDGIRVDRGLRTSNRRVFAIGDCREGPRLTHAAGDDAALVLRRAVLRLPARLDRRALPAVTFTDPELAQVGLTEAAAREKHGEVETLVWPFDDNDRAHTEGDTRGFVKVVRAGGRVVGVTIVGSGAGDLIQLWGLVVAGKATLAAVAGMTVAYPTRGEASKQVAFLPLARRLFGPQVRGLVRALARLP